MKSESVSLSIKSDSTTPCTVALQTSVHRILQKDYCNG